MRFIDDTISQEEYDLFRIKAGIGETSQPCSLIVSSWTCFKYVLFYFILLLHWFLLLILSLTTFWPSSLSLSLFLSFFLSSAFWKGEGSEDFPMNQAMPLESNADHLNGGGLNCAPSLLSLSLSLLREHAFSLSYCISSSLHAPQSLFFIFYSVASFWYVHSQYFPVQFFFLVSVKRWAQSASLPN